MLVCDFLPFNGHIKTAQHNEYQSSEEGPGRAAAPPNPLLAVPNITAHPSMASVPTSYSRDTIITFAL